MVNRFLDALILFDTSQSQSVAEKLSAGLNRLGFEVSLASKDEPAGVDVIRADTVVGIFSGEQASESESIHLAIEYQKRVLVIGSTASTPSGPTVRKWGWPSSAQAGAWAERVAHFCSQHQDYVRTHTDFLIRAIAWEHQHRQSDFLLVGELCQLAQAWLSQRFVGEKPPCIPTQLQCEYITESIKWASGDMAQVCLVGNGSDGMVADQIRHNLIRAGITVWAPYRDIQAASNYLETLRRGVEQADNLVLLLSEDSTSPAQQPVLERALTLNKRIIPVVIGELSKTSIPVALQTLQSIQLKPSQDDANDGQVGQALIQILREDAAYYEWHKRILVRALDWEAHHRSRSRLLQGGEFAIAKDWLEHADQAHRPNPPTDLHRVYIEASEEMNQFYDAFISYGRIDSKAFAIRLHQELTSRGYRIWFDQSDIPLAVDFQEQIKTGIEKAHNVIYIIGPHAVNSPYCDRELQLAQQYGKRIIPIMHVEEIDYATWLQRNPGGSPEAWEIYRARGLHSSYPGMNPDIRRLNWIFARSGQEEIEASLQGLLNTLNRYADYVEQHTYLLTRALYWERHQRQPQFFLTGQDLIDAEGWLARRFEETQPPCEPIALHAEYICGSLKYADGWMTQVFLAHSETDREIEERMRLSLMREGVPVWSSKVDIPYGKDFQTEIRRGIENTDNLLILLSTAALESLYCQQELAYALELNKRIIPVLIEPLETLVVHFNKSHGPGQQRSAQGARLFQQLQRLQFINFTSWATPDSFRHNLDKVLQLLKTNSRYYHEHKELLVLALKWQRQRENTSILLRGALLRYYQSWLKVARHQPHPPTVLQVAYLEASLHQPPQLTLDVFISCAPQDLEFARKLNEVLQVQGKTTWFAYESALGITPGAEELRAELEKAQNILVIVSPYWAKSEDCQQQLQAATALNKRVIKLLYQPVATSDLPDALDALPSVDFYHSEDFLTTFGQLYRLLESDPDHIQGHTRLLVRSREWEQSGCDNSFLLRGKELREAGLWLQRAENKTPGPTTLQRRYLHASHALPRQRVRWSTALGSGLIMGVGIALMRLLGGLEALELAAYDQMLKLRPAHPQDEHMLLVTVDNASGSWLREQLKQEIYSPSIGTIPDGALVQALDILSQADPALIGLDFYRDFEASPRLARRFRQMDKLIALCKASYEGEGVTPPPDVPMERVGFNDLVKDNQQYVRRHLLKQAADPEGCPTEDAFSLKLARRYLEQRGITYQNPWADNQEAPMFFGNQPVPQLTAGGVLVSHSGGYSPLGWQRLVGYQTLINFRAPRTQDHFRDAAQFAPVITLADLLQGQVNPELITDRVVIIGYSDLSDRSTDYYNTPYGGMAGMFLQAQMTSQLINATLEDWPLIWVWPAWGDMLWILAWGGVGASLFWRVVRSDRLAIICVGGIVLLYGTCYAVLTLWGGWLPLVPALLAAIAGGSLTAYFTYRIRHP